MNLSFDNVDEFCASVNLEVETPIIDLSGITFLGPYALVYLGMFIRYHLSKGKQFEVIIPNKTSVRNYLAQQNFWERFNFDIGTIQNEKLRRFSKKTSLNDIVDIVQRPGIAEEIAEDVKRVIVRNRANINANLVTEIVCELIDNFSWHSGCSIAAIAMQYYPNLHRIVFAVGDCGIGIRSSLCSNERYSAFAESPHHEVALMAFEPLVSRLPEGGTGLTAVKDNINELDGRLILTTGNGYVRIYQDQVYYGEMAYDLPGVQMELSLPEG